jgi:hypothetical protein
MALEHKIVFNKLETSLMWMEFDRPSFPIIVVDEWNEMGE